MYKKTKVLETPVSPEVAAFSVVMEAKLQMAGYDQVESWEGIPLPVLLQQIKAIVQRLGKEPLETGDVRKLFERFVELGSLSMMAAEMTIRRAETAPAPESSVVLTEDAKVAGKVALA